MTHDNEILVHADFVRGSETIWSAMVRLIECGFGGEDAERMVTEWADLAEADNSQFGVGA